MIKRFTLLTMVVFLIILLPTVYAQDGNRLFSDDFSTYANTWETPNTPDYTADYDQDNLAFFMDIRTAEQEVWSTPRSSLDLTAYVIEVTAVIDATSTADSMAGLLVNYVDEDNFYVFIIRASGYYEVRLRLDGEWLDRPLVFGKAAQADSYRLSVQSHNGVFELGLNGEPVVPFVNTELSGGKFGLYAQSGDGSMFVRFDDYLVRDLRPES
ncbi:MAG: hypothetical protein F9K46_02230 [Anaerolineae bacterium]|nr:MAG: hypothetical protein F9K46_02230 [Anaerolineae bacterium]